MQLISVNVGRAEPIQGAGKSGETGIYKRPVARGVQVSPMGLQGDTICDTVHHGGVDQAVYIYGGGDYAWWAMELGVDPEPGTFGENLTISELESGSFRVGDRLQMGDVLLEVTAPRIPCATLAARMGDPTFVKRFRRAERPGLYCRVIRPGTVRVGLSVTVVPYAGQPLPILELFRDFYGPDDRVETLRRHLAAPIAIRDRLEKEARLAQLGKGSPT